MEGGYSTRDVKLLYVKSQADCHFIKRFYFSCCKSSLLKVLSSCYYRLLYGQPCYKALGKWFIGQISRGQIQRHLSSHIFQIRDKIISHSPYSALILQNYQSQFIQCPYPSELSVTVHTVPLSFRLISHSPYSALILQNYQSQPAVTAHLF